MSKCINDIPQGLAATQLGGLLISVSIYLQFMFNAGWLMNKLPVIVGYCWYMLVYAGICWYMLVFISYPSLSLSAITTPQQRAWSHEARCGSLMDLLVPSRSLMDFHHPQYIYIYMVPPPWDLPQSILIYCLYMYIYIYVYNISIFYV